MYKVFHTPYGKHEILIGSNLVTLEIAKEVARLSLIEWGMISMSLADNVNPREHYRHLAERLVRLEWKQEYKTTWVATGDDAGTNVTYLAIVRIEFEVS